MNTGSTGKNAGSDGTKVGSAGTSAGSAGTALRLKVRIPGETTEPDRQAVHALLRYFEGTVPAFVYENGSRGISCRLSVDTVPALSESLIRLLGEENVKMETA